MSITDHLGARSACVHVTGGERELHQDQGMAYLTPDPPYAVVIDDDAVSREIVGNALHRFGLVPLLASSGEEAIELMAGTSAPVLIVLAFSLADMPTSELLAKFRADGRWARARVLLTSALPRASVPPDVRIDAFVQKPFDVESLLRATRAVMGAEPARGG